MIRRPSIAGETEPAHVEERVEVGVGKELAEHLEAALAAPHPGEPVVDERDSHVRVTRPTAQRGAEGFRCRQ